MKETEYGKALTILGEERLANFLRAATLEGADPNATWKAAQLSARTFCLQSGSGRKPVRWRTSFRACGKVQAVKAEL